MAKQALEVSQQSKLGLVIDDSMSSMCHGGGGVDEDLSNGPHKLSEGEFVTKENLALITGCGEVDEHTYDGEQVILLEPQEQQQS